MTRRFRTATAAALLLALSTVLVGVGAPAPAAARDSLSGSSPSDGQVVGGALQRVSITFSEPSLGIDGTSLIRVTGPDGSTVSDETTTSEGATVSVAVEFSTSGLYEVTWQNVSSDGHPIGLIVGIGAAVLALLAGAVYFVSKPRRPDGRSDTIE